jgi:hypothetical protein
METKSHTSSGGVTLGHAQSPWLPELMLCVWVVQANKAAADAKKKAEEAKKKVHPHY